MFQTLANRSCTSTVMSGRVSVYAFPRLGAMMLTLLLLCIVGCSAALPDMQDVSRPTPEPAAQSGWDVFTPPVSTASALSGTPSVAEWTRTGVSDDSLVLTGDKFSNYTGTGEGKDSQFLLYGQTTTGDGVQAAASIQRLDGPKAGITLPIGLPAWSTYLLWPKNSSGYGYPVAINRTEVWWLAPDDHVSRGDTVSVYGRNLSHSHGTVSSWVYIKPAGSAGQFATVTSVNPYRVQFAVPASCTNGTYEVWVHNGHGGSYGWAGPLTLVVTDAYSWNGSTFNVMSYGATGDGVTDDGNAINATLTAAVTYRNQTGLHPTVYLPTGTYMTSTGFGFNNDVRWLGDGMDQTIIRCNNNFSTSNLGLMVGNGGVLHDVELKDLTLDSNGNIQPYPASQGYLVFANLGTGSSDLRWTNVRMLVNSPGVHIAEFANLGHRLSFVGCQFIGGYVFVLCDGQVSFNGCDFVGANDQDTAIYQWGTSELSITGCTAEDYDINSPTGQSLGRLLSGNNVYLTQRYVYVADNTTTDLGPRAALGDYNTGEQIMCEGSLTQYQGSPTAATAATATLSDLSSSYATDSPYLVGQLAVIIDGRGLGQHRQITAYDSATKTITVSPAWNVAPDTDSVVIIEWAADKWVVYNNLFDGKNDYATRTTAAMAMSPYGGGYDWVGESNTITDMCEGSNFVCLQQYGSPIDGIQPCYFNYFANNDIQRCRIGIATGSGVPMGTTSYGPGFLGNVFRNNQVTDVTEVGAMQYCDQETTPDFRYALNVFEHNTFANLPQGFDGDDFNPGTRSIDTLLYKNSFTLGTAAYSGSRGYQFGVNQLVPGLRQNTWTGFETTYAGTLPGAILEVPTREFEVLGITDGGPETAILTIWNSGTASLSWAAASDSAWLTLTSSSGSIANENGSSSVTLTCDPASLTAGTYTGTVTITGASQTKKVTVTFVVAVAAPTFNPVAGNYTGTQSVTISTTTSGASIRYTTDGTTPSDTVGTVYSSAVDISQNTTLKAIAYKTGMNNSTVTSGAYSFYMGCNNVNQPANYFNQAYNSGSSRTDANAYLGYRFTVGANPIEVTALGRAVVEAMTQNHEISLWQDSNHTEVVSVIVTPSSSTDALGYKYEMLTSPVTLSAGGTYRILSSEAGGDKWLDGVGAITNHQSWATILGVAWDTSTDYVNGQYGYVPPTFYVGSGNRTVGDGTMRACRFQAGANITATQLLADISTSVPSKEIKCAIYADSTGSPGSFLMGTNELTNPGTGWITFTLTSPQSLISGTYYWLVVWANGSSYAVRSDSSGGTYVYKTQTYGTWPSSFGTPCGSDTLKYSIYAQ